MIDVTVHEALVSQWVSYNLKAHLATITLCYQFTVLSCDHLRGLIKVQSDLAISREWVSCLFH